jgi:hypothetical protein
MADLSRIRERETQTPRNSNEPEYPQRPPLVGI